MRMIRPKLATRQVTIAEDQGEFRPVTGALVTHPGYPTHPLGGFNSVVLAFRPSDEERARIAAGEDLYVSLLTFGQPMQGVLVLVGEREMAGVYRVPVEGGP